jgi:uncharacterized protein
MSELTDSDLQRLDDYLGAHCTDGGIESLEMLDGFLSAMVAGPEMVLPDEWMVRVLPEDHEFADEAEAAEISGLLLTLYNQIVERVGRVPAQSPEELDDADLPLFMLPADDEELDLDATEPPVGAGWALGFAIGRDLRPADWDTLCEEWEGLGEDLEEIDRLFEGLADDEPGPTLTLGERFEIMTAVPELLHDLYAARLVPETVRREEPKVGRNDPCPCGSGLKYKKCHGAN